METDLIKIYARSQLIPFSFYVFIVTGFIALKLYTHGFHDAPFYSISVGILFLGFLRLVRQRKFYDQILNRKNVSAHDWKKTVMRIAFDKATYMIPWLIIIFWPLQSQYLYNLLPGYLFVFCAMAAYASSSASYFPLYLWDVGMPLLFALGIAILNLDAEGTPYVGAVLLMFGFYTLISARNTRRSMMQLVQNRRALQKMANQAAQANKAKSDFLALMSHEIRTPMTGVLGMIDYLGETRLTREQAECLATIHSCSKTLLNTINDILDFSKIESGKLSISKIKFGLPSVLKESAAVLGPLAAEKGIGIEVNINANVSPLGYGDPHRVQQIVLNLLNNAVKFTERGSVILSAACKRQDDRQIVYIEVKDTGIGMDSETQGRLFQKFSQADDSISRKYGGSGLGLSIAKQLVELMGGKIGVRSVKGQGSAFWFEIPYMPAKADAGEKAGEAGASASSRQEGRLNILLVEDNKVNQFISTRTLTKKGHRVTVAANGESAVSHVKKNIFDLILMDVNLPGKSGIETTKEIKAMGGERKEIPVIALTANVTEESMQSCRQAGMVDYVLKPFTSEELYQVIARHAHPSVGKAAAGPHAGNAPAKKPESEAAPLNDKLQGIMEEFGPEYMNQVVEMCTREMESLIVKARSAYEERNYDLLCDSVHDLKSVSGSIGLRNIQDLAQKIEKLCADRQYAPLQQSVSDLVSQSRKEIDRLGSSSLSVAG